MCGFIIGQSGSELYCLSVGGNSVFLRFTNFNIMQKIAIALLLLASTFIPVSTDAPPVTVSGRAEKLADGKIALIGSASSVSLNFNGQTVSVNLKSESDHHNYVSFELDGSYKGRTRIEPGEARWYRVPVDKKGKHTLKVFKATEASNGAIIYDGAKAESLLIHKSPRKKKVEFIGNSITCGMGNDTMETPCGQGEWYDQHNAYWAYGPILSRTLNFDFVLSSVSGIGMYRNWNNETDPIMPDVYENLYLDKNTSKPFDNSFQPDVVSICLGTNDLSDGDGKTPRLPFNEKKYVSNYINFIKMIYKRYPKTRIVLLNSPMISGQKNVVLVKCLKEVIGGFAADNQHQPIELFEFAPMTPKGCGAHPDLDDHVVMAKQLEAVFAKLLGKQ